MNRNFREWGRVCVIGSTLLIALGMSNHALAAGTTAGTTVSNSASVVYDVQGVTQASIESSVAGNSTPGAGAPTEFTVDRKIDVLVTEVGDSFTIVRPGAIDQVLTFEVENEGNDVQDLLLTATDGAGNTITLGGVTDTDDFDATAATPPAIWVDDGDSIFNAALDTEVAYLDGLAVDTPVRVFVVRNISASELDGAASFVTLDAQAVVNSGTAAAPGVPLVEDVGVNVLVDAVAQIVFADDDGSATQGTDALRDGRHSATDGYLVRSAQLSIRKTAIVISDPFGNTSPNAKSIPGSIVEYEIRIENSATATETASGISISDDLSSEMSGAVGGPRLAFMLASYGAQGAGDDIELVTDQSGASVTTELSATADADSGEFVADILSVNNLVLDPGEFARVRFRVEIQ